jgi:hypothetical protein
MQIFFSKIDCNNMAAVRRMVVGLVWEIVVIYHVTFMAKYKKNLLVLSTILKFMFCNCF